MNIASAGCIVNWKGKEPHIQTGHLQMPIFDFIAAPDFHALHLLDHLVLAHRNDVFGLEVTASVPPTSGLHATSATPDLP